RHLDRRDQPHRLVLCGGGGICELLSLEEDDLAGVAAGVLAHHHAAGKPAPPPGHHRPPGLPRPQPAGHRLPPLVWDPHPAAARPWSLGISTPLRRPTFAPRWAP